MYAHAYLWWILFGIVLLLLFKRARNSIKIFVRRLRPPAGVTRVVPLGWWANYRKHLLVVVGIIAALYFIGPAALAFLASLYAGIVSTPPSGAAPGVPGQQWTEWFRNLDPIVVFPILGLLVVFFTLIIKYIKRGRTAPASGPVITHTGPPALPDQYRVRWLYTPFESAAAAFFIVVLSLGALIGAAYFLYGDTKAFQNLTIWAVKPMFLSMAAVVALIGESIAVVTKDDDRLKVTGAWAVIVVVGAIIFKWMWFLPPTSGDLFFVSQQGAILSQGLVFGATVFLYFYAWWKSNGDAGDVLAGFLIIYVIIIWGLQKSAINALLH